VWRALRVCAANGATKKIHEAQATEAMVDVLRRGAHARHFQVYDHLTGGRAQIEVAESARFSAGA
jgi:hypothetical protein